MNDASQTRQRPELLSPAGDLECVRAAVENGADAVYFGLETGFNARARATNLHLDALPELMSYLRERGVKGFVTLNTLIFPDELSRVEDAVVRLTESDVDAVLVQDLGLVRLIRAFSPDLAVHASTQMTLTSGECIRAVEGLGIERVVLARELSIREIKKIRSQTALELETFVHGALCVAYSGQCLTSESLGGRSANRGQCAQACRMSYELICDDQDVDLGDVKYLLSPQDLAAFKLVPELIDAGVNCFKIEGRLKTPEYVANITRQYRRAIDEAWQGRPAEFTTQDVMEMELSFSRGFSPGWLQGCDHKMLVPGLSSAKHGVALGEVRRIDRQRVLVRLTQSVSRGDGVVFDGDRENDTETGGRVYEIFSSSGQPLAGAAQEGSTVQLAFGRGAIAFEQLFVGQKVWKTDDPQLTNRLRKSFTQQDPVRRVPLTLKVEAAVGERLCISAQAANGAHSRIESDEPLVKAERHPLTAELLVKQLGRLGRTVYRLENVDANIAGQPMVPLSILGQLRRRLIESLARSLLTRTHKPLRQESLAVLKQSLKSDAIAKPGGTSTLRVLCRRLEQVEVAATSGASEILVDFQDIREYRQAVHRCRAAGIGVWIATPRIQKPDEMGIFRALQKHDADGFLVRNLAGIGFCQEQGLTFCTDFSLNAANPLTVDFLKEQGARRVTVSYDLNRDQVVSLVEAIDPQGVEVVVHQQMPMFHMEHCVFCAVLSPGTNKTNCGRPCDEHRVELRDRIGMEHPLHADVGCRNTLYNAVPQSAAEAVPLLLSRGVREFRVELLDQSPHEIRQVVSLYLRLLEGKVTGKTVWQELQASNRVGVTRGTLEERRNPLAII